MKVIDLYPQISVYRGMFKNVNNIVEYLEGMDQSEWEKWFIFGDIKSLSLDTIKYGDRKIDMNRDDIGLFKKQDGIDGIREVLEDLFHIASQDYVVKNNIDASEFIHSSPCVCRYHANWKLSDGVAMAYHTDFQQEKADEPGDKFRITGCIYLNDNYEGGDISFKIDGSEVVLNHKPQAGDILLFPSIPPYYHGVKEITSGIKYFVRTFWLYSYPGSKEWLDGQEKYGKEVWAEMEKERQKNERWKYFK